MGLALWSKRRWSRSPRRDFYSSAPGTAPIAGEKKRQFRITHPFHPFQGRAFDLVEHRWCFTQSILFFQDDTGSLQQIPADWTDFLKGDPFCEVAARRSPLHGDCLWPLAELLEKLSRKPPSACKGNTAENVNIITPIVLGNSPAQ
jgi:hypothetical protein